MNIISLPQAAKYSSPNPLTIVCTEKPDGTTNLATVSWWTYLSYNPGMFAFAMAQTSYSGEMVRNNHKVILTIPGAELAKSALECGSTTGRNTDKVKEFGIQLQEVEGSTIKVPVHTHLAIVGTMEEFYETGDHYLYVCRAEKVYGDEAEKPLFAWDGYAKVHPVE